jgi:Domain of unknown function (DUF5658)
MLLAERLRWILLGSDDSWGARVGTGPATIYALAVLTLLLHLLDLATGIRMMLVHGLSLEQNPIARAIMQTAGPLGLIEAKLAIVGLGVVLFLRAAKLGRARLARNCLLMAAALGAVGLSSNLV